MIVHNVHQVAAQLQRKREEVRRWQEANDQQAITWQATRDLRAAGQISLIDVILTEQGFTSTRLQLAQAQHDLASQVVRLRFESGELVPFRDGAPGDANIRGLLITP